jgi:hypothetical protein
MFGKGLLPTHQQMENPETHGCPGTPHVTRHHTTRDGRLKKQEGGNDNNFTGSNRRDKNGMTEKMRASIPIIAAARTRREGIQQCQKFGIIGSGDGSERHFYRAWLKHPYYRSELERERERVQGEMAERIQSLMMAYEEDIVEHLCITALSSRADKIRAAELILTLRGYPTGKGVRLNQQIIQANQNNLPELERLSDAELMQLVRREGVLIGELIGSGGDGSGDGNPRN